MRTKRLFTGIVAMLFTLALVGAGFSIWYFNDSITTEATQNPSTDVEQLLAVGDITKADDFTIVFDQTTAGRNDTTLNVPATGITFDWNGNTNKVAKYNKPTEDNYVDEAANTKRVFTVTIDVQGALANYIDFTTSQSGWVESTTNVFTYDIPAEAEDASFDWMNVSVAYTAGNEPTNVALYEQFKTAVEASTITVTYNVTIVADNA